MSAKVRDVMTTDIVSVTSDTSFKELAAMFRRHRVSAFPVTGPEGAILGVVSEADLLPREALRVGVGVGPGPLAGLLRHQEPQKMWATTAKDLMTSPPVTITPDEPVMHAARMMYACKMKWLAVVDADGRLAGIVSRADVLAVYSRPDTDIRHEIIEKVILTEFRTDPGRFTVTVKDGVVTLEGSPETTDNGLSIVRESRQVEGVVAVHDRLRYPPEQ